VDQQIALCREEIARLILAIARVEHDGFSGPLKYQLLAILRGSLEQCREALVALETQQQGFDAPV
jgi:hypothetical protein